MDAVYCIHSVRESPRTPQGDRYAGPPEDPFTQKRMDEFFMMQVLKYQMTFTAPAFLGDAEQSGRWRTPPIKALLRQWWRMVYAEAHTPSAIGAMREKEGNLLGNAWLDSGATKSKVRIRLDHWNTGTLLQSHWPALEKARHPEVKQMVGADLYMGFGPVMLPRGEHQPKLKANAAIQAGDHAILSVAVPDSDASDMARALWLMDRYGTLGGRSRNGWGSFTLTPMPGEALPGETLPIQASPILQSWETCLNTDWPHAIGKDAKGPLIWETSPFSDWKTLMVSLAQLKIDLRTSFKFGQGNPEARHWLAYPVTHHKVNSWSGNARLPNMLRFKIRATPDGQVVGVIYLVPHLPPQGFSPDRKTVQQVWSEVLKFMDQPERHLRRIPV